MISTFRIDFTRLSGRSEHVLKYIPPDSMKFEAIGIPTDSSQEPLDRYVHYTGSSMFPTFKDPEFLEFERVGPDDLRVGDVIIFSAPHMTNLVVHRIVRIAGDVYITRGDNNQLTDPPVRFDEVTGRAIRVIGKKDDRIIRNGSAGMTWARWIRTINLIRRWLLSPLANNPFTRSIDHLLRHRAWIHPSVVIFQQPDGNHRVHLFWRGWLIGAYRTLTGNLHIRRPFNYLISNPCARELVRVHLLKRQGIEE